MILPAKTIAISILATGTVVVLILLIWMKEKRTK
jgi:hypothetical protein